MRLLRIMLLIVCGSSLAILHYTAVTYSLYWLLPELDIISHLLGGFVVALAVKISISRFHNGLQVVPTVIGATLMVALAWEAFELITNTAGDPSQLYSVDTATDIGVAVISAFVVALFL